jgi:hypothetical protein
MPELRKRGGTWGFVNIAWLKGNLCGEGNGTSKHLNTTSWDLMKKVCVWWTGGKFSGKQKQSFCTEHPECDG